MVSRLLKCFVNPIDDETFARARQNLREGLVNPLKLLDFHAVGLPPFAFGIG